MGLFFRDSKDHLRSASADATRIKRAYDKNHLVFRRIEKTLEDLRDEIPSDLPPEYCKRLSIELTRLRRYAERSTEHYEKLEGQLEGFERRVEEWKRKKEEAKRQRKAA